MNFLSKHRLVALCAGAACLTVSAHADTFRTGYLYVSDYGASELDRFQYTFNETTKQITGFTPFGIGNNTTDAHFLGDPTNMPVKEGIHGTSNDIILVSGAHGSTATIFSRYNFDGTLIGTIPVNFSSYNGGNVGIGNTVITPDGRFLYAPLETAGKIVKISLADGSIVANYTFAGAHDIALAANGDIFAANYSNGSASVIRLNSSLAFQQELIANSANFHPSGLSIIDDNILHTSSLFVQNNTRGGDDSVLRYELTGSGTLTATLNSAGSYLGSSTNNALEFTFGNNVGPDGKIYIAALGGGGTATFSTRKPYQDGIYVFDPVTKSVSLAIAGYLEKTGGGVASSSGFVAPKYLQFDTNFVDSPDAGVPTPEVNGNMFMAALGLGSLMSRRGFRAMRRI